MRLRIAGALALFGAAFSRLAGADSADEKAVVAAIQTVFDGIAGHDSARMLSALAADARLTRIRGDQPAATVSAGEFVKAIEGNPSRLLERMWDPKVMVSGRLAAVWAPYDFHLDGKFTHCGIDSFLLVKDRDGWKITSVAYTVQTEACAPSPLGPPK
jgi:hypothetical protein